MSFAIFALAFVARPLGTALSMAVQRRWGRATKLTLALFLLGICTVGMAFLPSYQQAGVNAIIALAVLRVGQGIALGGSWDGLPSLLAMSAPKNRRGWYSMMGQLGAPLGFVLAAGLFAFIYAHVGADEFLSWAGAIPSAWPLPSTSWHCSPGCAWSWASPTPNCWSSVSWNPWAWCR
jgi:MFS family permease